MIVGAIDEKYYLSDKMKQYISKKGTNGYTNPDCKINKIIARPITTDPNKRAGTTNYISRDVGDEFDLNEENVKQLRIRKLTPKECWRLMGFKDESFEKAKYENIKLYLLGSDNICNAELKIVKDKSQQNDTETYVLCTISDLKEQGQILIEQLKNLSKQELEKIQNVNFVIERLVEPERLKCVTNTTKCIDFMGMHFTLINEKDLQATVIIVSEKKGSMSTEKYMKITTESNLHPIKLYIILTLIGQIMKSKIFTSTTLKTNIHGYIANIENYESNILMKNLYLEMDITKERTSNSMMYKQAGNSIVVDVLEKIINNLHLELEHIKLLELFGGIGACSEAMENLGLDFEIADYVEIDKYAVASYNAMHNTNFEPQDITTWDKDIKVDFVMHGSPCQDFSLAGKQAGGDEGSGTRSSLMYETVRIVEKLRPKYVLWENVKNVIGSKHKHNFDNYLNKMEELGYKNYYQVLNAKDYGIPQNRERVFTLSILDGTKYEFPPKEELKLKLKDILEDSVEEKYYLSDKQVERIHKSTYNVGKTRIQEPIACEIRYDEGIRTFKDNVMGSLRTIDACGDKCIIEKYSHLGVNKATKETLEKNIDKLTDGAFIDSYNKNIRTDGLSGTITTRVSASNNTYASEAKQSKYDFSDLD